MLSLHFFFTNCEICHKQVTIKVHEINLHHQRRKISGDTAVNNNALRIYFQLTLGFVLAFRSNFRSAELEIDKISKAYLDMINKEFRHQTNLYRHQTIRIQEQ